MFNEKGNVVYFYLLTHNYMTQTLKIFDFYRKY